MRTLVIIPAFREEAAIVSVVADVRRAGFDALVVDDGSPDATAQRAREAGAAVVRHPVNRGQGAALRTGIAFAQRQAYEAVVFFDADGQMVASEIPHVLEPLIADQADVVLGSRFLGTTINMPWRKWLTLKAGLAFTWLTSGLRLTDVHNGFQAWRLSALVPIPLVQDRQAYASELLYAIATHRLRYLEVPVTVIYHRYGQSVLTSVRIIRDLMLK